MAFITEAVDFMAFIAGLSALALFFFFMTAGMMKKARNVLQIAYVSAEPSSYGRRVRGPVKQK